MSNSISYFSLPEKVKAISSCVLLVKANVATTNNSSTTQIDGHSAGGAQANPEEKMEKARALFASAMEKYERQDFSGAYKDVSKSVELYPAPENRYAKGYIAASFNDADVAISELEYCIEKNYKEPACCDIIARAYQAKMDWGKAIFYYNKLIDFDKKYVDAYVNRALCYSQLGKTDESLSDYLKAIKYDGVIESQLYALAYNNVAYTYLEKGDLEKAKGYIEKSIEHNHMLGFAWDTYGELSYKIGEYTKCIECMNNSITISNTAKDESYIKNSYTYRGLAKKAIGDLTGAYKDLELAEDKGDGLASVELSRIKASYIDFSLDYSYDIMYPNPPIRKRESTSLAIKGVEKSDECTIIYCQLSNTEYRTGGWYCIYADTYIQDKSTGKTHKLISTENCAVEPYRTPIGYGETNSFALYFPAISKDAEEIDFIEPGRSEWKFYGIKLKQ